MKKRFFATLLALFALVVCLIPVPVAGAGSLHFSPTTGPVGTNVTITGPSNYGEGTYYLYWETSNQLIEQGIIEDNTPSLGFVVPEATRGKHKVILTIGEDSFEREFTVTPAISINADEGPVGSNLTIAGKGFDSNESTINVTYDGIAVQTAVRASSKGSWQASFKVPASSRGKHVIDAAGSTPAEDVPDQQFIVVPQISTNPASGWVGSMTSILGSGFDTGETNITITYDGLITKGGITADAKGSWHSSFSIPTSAKGVHMIDAYGATTEEADVADVTFTVSPGIKLELASGYLGGAVHSNDKLWVSGIGFETNESGIQITFDGAMVASNIIADAKGSWSTQIEVPPTSKGEHKIGASGETTQTSDIADAIVFVSPVIAITPTGGNVGDEVVINGTGFGENQVITISWDGNQLNTETIVATDAKGSFIASAKVPKAKAGDRTVTVTDSSASVASTKFTVEANAPATPSPVAPEAGTDIGASFLGLGKKIVAFQWSEVEDPSGVSYTLEVSKNADFTGAILHKENLTENKYTLTDSEALGKGEYYWRVQAIDEAGNESDWTNGQFFKVSGIDWMVIALIVVGVIILFFIIRRVVAMRRRSS